MPAIQIDGLTKVFDDTTAVDHVSFDIAEGELFGLLGPNGAGKTTLVQMLATLLRPTTGTATVNGFDITEEMGAVRDTLGIVFQERSLDEELTGAENLAFHARLYGQRKTERERRLPEVLDLVDLTEKADDPVGTYSGGMQRRLEIARALMHEPAVLFLDEPTVGLDAHTRRDTWEYIQRLNEERGVTTILTTHYMEEAEYLCNRVAIMDRGEIVAIDSPHALKASLGGDTVALGIEDASQPFCDRLADQPWVHEYTVTDAGVHVTLEHGETRVADLVRLATDAAVAITSVDIHKPSLETVFLSLTGRTIAEREAAERTDTGDDPIGTDPIVPESGDASNEPHPPADQGGAR